MMATDTSIKHDGLCSLTAQKLSEEHDLTGGPPARNHPDYPAEAFCEREPTEPHMIKIPYPGDQNMKKLAHDMKFTHKKGIELKNNELGKVRKNILDKKAHAEDDTKKMDEDLATKLKERSQKVDEDKEKDYLPAPPEFTQVQLRKTGSRELLNIE